MKAVSFEVTTLCVCECAEYLVFNGELNTAERRLSPIAVQQLVSSALRRAVPN